MTVGLLICGDEIHKAYNVKRSAQRKAVDNPALGGIGGDIEVGKDVSYTLETETAPTHLGIYELRCKDETGCKRFQVMQVTPQGKRFLVAGAQLADEGF